MDGRPAENVNGRKWETPTEVIKGISRAFRKAFGFYAVDLPDSPLTEIPYANVGMQVSLNHRGDSTSGTNESSCHPTRNDQYFAVVTVRIRGRCN